MLTNNQKLIDSERLKPNDRISKGFKKGKVYKTLTDSTRATTPPSFLGIARSIAYIGKKYHSGWMWEGVTNGLALIKFSGSINKLGKKKTKKPNTPHIIKNPAKSLIVKYEWNSIFSEFEFKPNGLEEPVSCKKTIWSRDKPEMTKGSKKCKA